MGSRGKNQYTEMMPIVGAFLFIIFLIITVIMIIKTGYLADEGISLPLNFGTIIWFGIPVSFVSILTFYALEKKMEKGIAISKD